MSVLCKRKYRYKLSLFLCESMQWTVVGVNIIGLCRLLKKIKLKYIWSHGTVDMFFIRYMPTCTKTCSSIFKNLHQHFWWRYEKKYQTHIYVHFHFESRISLKKKKKWILTLLQKSCLQNSLLRIPFFLQCLKLRIGFINKNTKEPKTPNHIYFHFRVKRRLRLKNKNIYISINPLKNVRFASHSRDFWNFCYL